jgi:hypothetical protein
VNQWGVAQNDVLENEYDICDRRHSWVVRVESSRKYGTYLWIRHYVLEM